MLRLLPGDYQVSAYREGWRSDNVDTSVQAGQTNLLGLELSPPPKISRTVRQPDGQPAAGAEVQVVGIRRSDSAVLRTDSAGHFETEWDPRRSGRFGSTACLLVRMPEEG